jgi:glycogen debranching enzyme
VAKRMLFNPKEYEELSPEERSLLELAYEKALEALRRNVTPRGFTACSLADNKVYGTDANYRAVWARDGAKTILWTLDLEDEEIRACQVATLRTVLGAQAPTGQIPGYVGIDDGRPEYAGVGGITSLDSALWIIIAAWRYAHQAGDWSIVETYAAALEKGMDWLSAHDSNNCGMLEVPEAGDWTDLFARSYHVLYDEVLWYRCLIAYGHILRHLGEAERAADYERWSQRVRAAILRSFWPSTAPEQTEGIPSFSDVQFALGDARYLVAQISPFSYSWRCDVYANVLAYLMKVIDKERAMMTFRFMWGSGVNEPGPVQNLYPPVHAGDPEWREYFTVNLLNLPNHYHNGGIWPFIGGLWVRYIHKLGMPELARRELVRLARLCSQGVSQEWEFNEWHHGITGRPMGKAFQAWSAASFLQACHDLNLDPESIRSEE